MVAYLVLLGAVLALVSVGLYPFEHYGPGFAVNMTGAAFAALGFLLWPRLCCQGQTGTTGKVVGIARAHDMVSTDETARLAAVPADEVRGLVCDGIGSGKLSGTLEGDVFVRSACAAPSRGGAKVCVICRYRGAKTEQGKSKCDNCGADL